MQAAPPQAVPEGGAESWYKGSLVSKPVAAAAMYLSLTESTSVIRISRATEGVGLDSPIRYSTQEPGVNASTPASGVDSRVAQLTALLDRSLTDFEAVTCGACRTMTEA